MAKKKNNDNNENQNNESNNEGETKKKEGGHAEKKKDDKSPMNVVLKVEIDCEGCASKIVKCVRGFEGVQSVKADMGSNKLTVVGEVDPSKIRDKLEQKIKKKVDLISPQPKKDKDKDKDKDNAQKPNNQSKDKPTDDKKPKEPPVTTVVLKLPLHCQGCIEKIQKTVQKTKGVLSMTVDKQTEQVTVRGAMDAKTLAEALKERLKRTVEIVQPKKEKEEKESNCGGKKKKGGGGEEGGDGGGKVDNAEKNGGGGGRGGGGGGGGGGDGKMEGHKMEQMVGLPGLGYGYPYPLSGYDYGYPVGHVHAPQIFSDENPNACSVM